MSRGQRQENREAYKIYLAGKDGKRKRESKIYSSYNYNSWSTDHMTDPRWNGIDRGLVLAYELPSPAPGYHFIRQFGQSDRQSIASGTEDPNVTQALVLLNGPIHQCFINQNALLAKYLGGQANHQKINTLFRSILTRNPTEEDFNASKEILKLYGDWKGIRMITWSLINTREFMYIQ